MWNYYCFIIFTVIAYLILTDNSISQYVVYLTSTIKFNYEKTKWWILNNPKNPIVRYFMYRRSLKMAKEILKEFGIEDNNDK